MFLILPAVLQQLFPDSLKPPLFSYFLASDRGWNHVAHTAKKACRLDPGGQKWLAYGKSNRMQKTFPIFEKRTVVESISLKQQHAAGSKHNSW